MRRPQPLPAGPIPGFPLRPGRTHEAGGPAAAAFAAVCAGGLAAGARVLWVVEDWQAEGLNPEGYAAFADPAALLVARAADAAEVLAVGEEGLRSGAVALVVMEVTRPLSLTAGRRLQLAAEAGRATGLCLVPEGMGSNATETRWHCTPMADEGDSTLWHWSLTKNKSGTTGLWTLRWDDQARRLLVVSPPAQRPGTADAPG